MVHRDITVFNPDAIKKFYSILKFTGFRKLTEDRKQILDTFIAKYRDNFLENSCGPLSLACYTAEKLTTNPKKFSIENDDERVYVYIKILDPDFKFLEAYEMANLKDEVREICFVNFHYYDPNMILFERRYNAIFQEFAPDDLWARESIKRARLPKN